MRKSIATVSLSGRLEDKLAAIARAKFDGVEIFENDLIGCPLPPEEIARRAADLGLTIELYQPFRDFEAVPADAFARNLRRAEGKLDLMARLGAPMLLVCSNVSASAIDDDGLAAEQLHRLAELAYSRGLRVAYEALAWGRHVDDYEHAYAIVAAADHPHLGVCLDSFHILSRGTALDAIRTVPAGKISFVQLADAPRLSMDVLQWSRHYRCFPGQGGFDLAAFMAEVLAAGYRGPLSLEVFSDVFRRSGNRHTAVDAMRSLLYLEESLRSRPAAEPAGRIRQRIELFDPPAPPALAGYAFAELAPADGSLANVLAAFGFTRTGRHRSKPVDLWQQGEIRLLLNAEPSDGSGLAVVGLDVDDGSRAANRAAAFLDRPVERRQGYGEADLPAIPLTEEFALQVCDGATWLGDFEQTSPQAPGPLTRIDHLALSLPYDRYDEVLLLLRTVLALEPLETFELPDPHGLVRSRALTTHDGTVRIALNLPDLGGQPVHRQHLAFACDDILAAAGRLRGNGLRLLPISPNYYEDLRCRTDLTGMQIERLQEYGILYDRDDSGEFFHFYTEQLGGGLFFEVVERRGGYTGFGAVNAGARLAAQR